MPTARLSCWVKNIEVGELAHTVITPQLLLADFEGGYANPVYDLFVSWGFTSWQHLRSQQDGYQLVMLGMNADFIGKPDYCPDTELTSPCPILVMPSARLWSKKYEFSKSLV